MTVVFLSDIVKFFVILSGVVGLFGKSGLRDGHLRADLFIFFTNVSIGLAVLFYPIDCIVKWAVGGEGALLSLARGGIVTYLFVVALVFNLVLVPMYRKEEVGKGIYTPEDVLVHCVTPALALFDWIMFPPVWFLPDYAPLCWLLVPIVYVLMLVLRERLAFGPKIEYINSYYPYIFIARDIIGTKRMLKGVLVLMVLFLFVGYFVRWLNGIALVVAVS